MKEKSKFKVGDRVACKFGTVIYHGEVVEVNSGKGRRLNLCRFDGFDGHNGNGYTLSGTNYNTEDHWYCYDSDLKLIHDNWKVVIMPTGDVTLGRLYKDGKVVKSVETTKHPDDEYCIKTACDVIMERLFEHKNIVKQDTYEVGDKVKIVDQWVEDCYQNFDGRMDKWLGKVMTIREFKEVSGITGYKMVEDKEESFLGEGWTWFPNAIEGKVIEEPTEPAFKPLKKFEEGKTYVFRKDLYEKDMNTTSRWSKECDGKLVTIRNSTDGKIGLYEISPEWCEEVKEVEPPKYYNGKVVCVKKANDFLTEGKIYEFVDGVSTDDDGDKLPCHGEPVKSLEDLNDKLWSDFIEVVE